MNQKHKATGHKESTFNSEVVSRFELYNSLFLTLPFYKIKDTGTLLPLFIKHCEEGDDAARGDPRRRFGKHRAKGKKQKSRRHAEAGHDEEPRIKGVQKKIHKACTYHDAEYKLHIKEEDREKHHGRKP